MAAIRSRRFLLAAVLAALLAGGAAFWLLRPKPAGKSEQPGASACVSVQFEGSHFTACRYRRGEDRLELILNDDAGRPLRSFPNLERQLGPRAAGLRFAMNAGMFDETGQPIGLYVEDGREVHAINRREGPGNFHLMPNGVFTVDALGQVAVVRSDAYKPADIAYATQSGPMLVIDGALHPRISDNGESVNIRNGVGVSAPDTAWFAISDEPVSFGRFARMFRDRLGCANALFLDGTVSSLWDRPAGRQDPNPALGPLVAVFSDDG
jgi:uncharacterized protein YigE (DUF2233 family)